MKYPFRENLEVHVDEGRASIRCTKCSHVLCPLGKDWEIACKRRLLPPTKAGPLMRELVGSFLLEQLYCPTCATLLKSELVGQKKDAEIGRVTGQSLNSSA